jgi:hypothetical protein
MVDFNMLDKIEDNLVFVIQVGIHGDDLTAAECYGTGSCFLKYKLASVLKLMAPGSDPLVVDIGSCEAYFFDIGSRDGFETIIIIPTVAESTEDGGRESVVVPTLEKVDGMLLDCDDLCCSSK